MTARYSAMTGHPLPGYRGPETPDTECTERKTTVPNHGLQNHIGREDDMRFVAGASNTRLDGEIVSAAFFFFSGRSYDLGKAFGVGMSN